MSTADIDREESRAAARHATPGGGPDATGCTCAGGHYLGHQSDCAGLPTLYGGGQP